MDATQQPRPVGWQNSRLPLWVGLGAVALFLFTINRWVSILSLPALVQAGGWDWTPPVYQPLSYVLTLPVKFLPVTWQPFALNLLSVALSAATLTLLARSVILLPHDRTREQRRAEPSEHSFLSVPNAWIPPVFAAAVAGFQLSFWENATSFSPEMLDVFVFAFCTWSLLEFRLDQRESRLIRMAFVYGLGVTNNYAMIAFFPGFLTAVIWIRGAATFRAGFALRMLAGGIAGLLLYLLLPLLGTIRGTDYTFWQLLKANLGAQKNILFSYPKYVIVLLSLTSLAPVFAMGIRWPGSEGETTATGENLTRLGFHALHGVFLTACLVVAFDPKFSPRQLGLGLQFLPFYYLGALSIGYFSGYFLAVMHPRAQRQWGKHSLVESLGRKASYALVVLAAAAVPLGLIYKNLPVIRATNGPALREFIQAKAARLPATGGLLLADDPVNLRLLEAELRGQKRADQFVFVDTRLMPNRSYQKFLGQQHPTRWIGTNVSSQYPPLLDSPALINLLIHLSRSNSLFYLHPSFGYYFEAFHLLPHGMVYEMKPYAPGVAAPPPLTLEAIRENADFWKQLGPSMGDVIRRSDPRNFTLVSLGRNYSLGLNHWGVELQRAGQLEAAGKLFELAVQLNPDNASASLNIEYNQNLKRGVRTPVELTKAVTDRFGKYRSWDAVLGACGPIDEPALTMKLGQEFQRNFQYRQAAVQFNRVTELTPDNVEAHISLINALTQGNLPDLALKLIGELRASGRPLAVTHQIDLVKLEARAHYIRGDLPTAEKLLRAAQPRFPLDDSLLDSLSQLYLLSGKFAEATAALDEQLRLTPDSPRALLNKGAVEIQLKHYAAALPALNRLVKLQPQNTAGLMNRAIALLQTGQFEAARQDYELLRGLMPNQFAVHYGLGEVALRKGDPKAAIEHFRAYLKLAPTNSEEYATVRQRLTQLQAGR